MAVRNAPCLENCGSRAIDGSSYCKAHQPEAFRINYRKQRLPKNWGSLRRTVLERDNYICYICSGDNADSVDHVVNNDNDDLSNLKAVHQNVPPYCHRTKTAEEGNKAKGNTIRYGETIYERAKKKGII